MERFQLIDSPVCSGPGPRRKDKLYWTLWPREEARAGRSHEEEEEEEEETFWVVLPGDCVELALDSYKHSKSHHKSGEIWIMR